MENGDRIVAMTTFTVTQENFNQVAREAKAALEDEPQFLEGFLGGWLLVDEKRKKIVFISEWKSRHTWAAAQWDEDIARTVADMFQQTASYNLEFFYPLATATPQHR